MEKTAVIYVSQPEKFIGRAIVRVLEREGYKFIVGRSGGEPDLTDRTAVSEFFRMHRPEYVFLCAGKTAGIEGNINYPADLMLNNLQVQCNVMEAAHGHGVRKLVYLASSCCYPRDCSQPMKEEYLLSGKLEPTNESYAIAKISGIKLCEAFRKQFGTLFVAAIPANCFGPGDSFDPANSHVIAALIQKMHLSKQNGEKDVDIWGTGSPVRDFIYVDDLAGACIFIMKSMDIASTVNIGSGSPVSIRELAELIKNTVGFQGNLRFDTEKPDGMPEKVLDTSIMDSMGYRNKTDFVKALGKTYEWFLENIAIRGG